MASKDIRLADPQAVVVVNACAQAFDRVGLPEGRYPLESNYFRGSKGGLIRISDRDNLLTIRSKAI